MSGSSWRFRTTSGTVSVRSDAVVIRRTPGQFLAGQAARWRVGGGRQRATVALQVGAFAFSLVGLGYHLLRFGDPGARAASLFYVGSTVFFLYGLWAQYLRQTTVPFSALTRVTVDADARKLTVAHETDDGPLSVFREAETETTLVLPTEDDLREAREILRLRSVPVESASAVETETTYRFESRNGVCFCERCGSQVSPSDGVCPSCAYALRVETTRA